MQRRDCVEFSVFHAIRYTTEHHIIAPSVLGEICGLGNCATKIETLLYCVLFMICDFISKTGQVKTSKSKFPPKICHIDSIYGSKALETAFYFMQLLHRP